MAKHAINYAKRTWLWVGITSVALLSLSILPMSRLVINPQEVTIVDNTVFLHRTFPLDTLGLPRPRLSYVEYVRGFSPETNGGHTCQDSGGPFKYISTEEAGFWEIPWAEDCTGDQIGFKWEACWSWHIGVLKLGPTCKSTIIFKPQNKL